MSFLRLRRKLEDDLIRDATYNCSTDCDKNSNAKGFCQQSCVYVCPEICQYVEVPLSPPNRDDHQKSKRISIIAASVLTSAVLLVCLLALYLNSRRRRRSTGARSRSSRLVVRTNDDQFLDEDHGPIIDHPIWHIRTIGLQPSVISSIKVCRYRRKGDGGGGLVEGTDCSVCLSEFQEDETLRVLPKCNHAFHLPCIDTWLRSHTTCPLCRAPIVVNGGATLTQSSSSTGVMNNNNTQNPDEIRLAIPEEDEEETAREVERDEEEVEGESCEDNDYVGYNIEEAEVQRVRRSVSMDSLSALRISQDVTDEAKQKESNLREHGNGKIMRKLVGSGSSSFLKRSVSCSGKFFLPRYS